MERFRSGGSGLAERDVVPDGGGDGWCCRWRCMLREVLFGLLKLPPIDRIEFGALIQTIWCRPPPGLLSKLTVQFFNMDNQ